MGFARTVVETHALKVLAAVYLDLGLMNHEHSMKMACVVK